MIGHYSSVPLNIIGHYRMNGQTIVNPQQEYAFPGSGGYSINNIYNINQIINVGVVA